MSLHICAATKTPCQSPLTCSKHEDCPKRTDLKAMQMLGAPACVIGSALAGQSPAAVRKENDQFSGELDRLRAENAGLKTGYEAYERVNAELRAECEKLRKYGEEFASLAERRREQAEALRKDADRYEWLKLDDVERDHLYTSTKGQELDAAIDAAMSKEQSHD